MCSSSLARRRKILLSGPCHRLTRPVRTRVLSERRADSQAHIFSTGLDGPVALRLGPNVRKGTVANFRRRFADRDGSVGPTAPDELARGQAASGGSHRSDEAGACSSRVCLALRAGREETAVAAAIASGVALGGSMKCEACAAPAWLSCQRRTSEGLCMCAESRVVFDGRQQARPTSTQRRDMNE